MMVLRWQLVFFFQINKRVIDNTEGDTFDLLWVDLNRDNKSELLVSYNKAKNGTVFIYDFPSDFR